MAPLPVPTSQTRTAGAPGGRGAPVSIGADALEAEVHQQLRLGPRDEHPRIDREGQPVELPHAPDVGDRLAGRAAARRAPGSCSPTRRRRAPRDGPGRRSGRCPGRAPGAPRRPAAACPTPASASCAWLPRRAVRRRWPSSPSPWALRPARRRRGRPSGGAPRRRSSRRCAGPAGRPPRRPRPGSRGGPPAASRGRVGDTSRSSWRAASGARPSIAPSSWKMLPDAHAWGEQATG